MTMDFLCQKKFVRHHSVFHFHELLAVNDHGFHEMFFGPTLRPGVHGQSHGLHGLCCHAVSPYQTRAFCPVLMKPDLPQVNSLQSFDTSSTATLFRPLVASEAIFSLPFGRRYQSHSRWHSDFLQVRPPLAFEGIYERIFRSQACIELRCRGPFSSASCSDQAIPPESHARTFPLYAVSRAALQLKTLHEEFFSNRVPASLASSARGDSSVYPEPGFQASRCCQV
mmetsp:Transcript_9033/g.22182  ORF Transcript_9033/g.22182 Transcript_9033/m.22182 type:complete len:225 (+) Transcript_9033:1763-2437(+)